MTTLDLHIRARLAEFEVDACLATAARSIGIFGPSGAGKTTILDAIVGWRKPDSGHVRIGDRFVFDSSRGLDVRMEQREVGYVAQEALLFPHWSVARNVTATKRCDDAFLARLFETLGLRPLADRLPESLSGGESRRVALARAIATRPRILVLDEPLTGLDRALRTRVLSDLMHVRAVFDIPLVLVSHDRTEMIAACEEVFVLERGRVVAEGAPDRVLRDRTHPGAPFENVILGTVREVDGPTVRVAIDDGPHVFAIVEGARAGERVWLSVDAEDVLIADVAPTRISARNVIPAHIVALAADGEGRTRVEARLGAAAGAPSLLVDVTRSAAVELALSEGRAVHLVFKAGSCRAVARGAEVAR